VARKDAERCRCAASTEPAEQLAFTGSSAATVSPLLTTLAAARQLMAIRSAQGSDGCRCDDSHAWLRWRLAALSRTAHHKSPAAPAAASAAPAGRKEPARLESTTTRASDASTSSNAAAAAAAAAADSAAGIAEHPLWLSFLGPDARVEWARAQIRARAPEYTTRRPLSVRVCTWNVNARPPPPAADLRSWLLGNSGGGGGGGGGDDGGGGGGRPDVIAVGLQEVIALTATALMVGHARPAGRPAGFRIRAAAAFVRREAAPV
jgi:hypothetical protein